MESVFPFMSAFVIFTYFVMFRLFVKERDGSNSDLTDLLPSQFYVGANRWDALPRKGCPLTKDCNEILYKCKHKYHKNDDRNINTDKKDKKGSQQMGCPPSKGMPAHKELQ